MMMTMMMIIFSDIFITLLYFYDCYPWVKNLLQDAKNPTLTHTHTLSATSTHTHSHTHKLAQHSLTLSHTHACARWASFFHLMSKPLVFERLCKKEREREWAEFSPSHFVFFFRLVQFFFILNLFLIFPIIYLLTLSLDTFNTAFNYLNFFCLIISPRKNLEFWANLWINF